MTTSKTTPPNVAPGKGKNTFSTEKQIQAAKPRGTPYRLRDENTIGLYLQVTPAGTKTWTLKFTSPEVGTEKTPEVGQRRFYPLGRYPDVTLKDARSEAGKVRDIINAGIDPIEEDARQEEVKQEAEQDATTGLVRELFDLYVQDLTADGKRSAKQVEGAFAYNCGDILDMKASEVTMLDVAAIISDVNNRSPGQSRHVRNYMNAAFTLGLNYKGSTRWAGDYKRGKLPDFQLAHNPVASTESIPINDPRRRFLSKEEVKTLWHSMGVDALSADLAIAIKLLLATGQRVEEVLHATWDEFDLDEMVWTIPATRRKSRGKNPHDHLVPLTQLHVGLLEELQGIANHDVYLFPHRDGEKPRGADSLGQAINRFCVPGSKSTRTGFEKFLPKDCRRTFKTLGAKHVGLSIEIRNRLQGHGLRDIGSTTYDCHEYLDEKRAAMARWSRWLDELVTGKTSKKVVSINGKSA